MRRTGRVGLRGWMGVALAAAVLGAAPAAAADDYAAILQQATKAVKSHNLPKALELFASAVKADPTQVDAYFNAGSVAQRLKRCREVLLYFRGFLFLSPGTPDDAQAKAALAQCEGKDQAGLLTVRSDPKGMEVSLDGVLQGRTPMTGVKVPAGTFRLGATCRCPDYDDHVREVTIVAGQEASVEMVLARKPAFGWLQVKTVPEAGVSVFLDEKPAGTTPLDKVRLETRKHFLRLEMPGFDPWVRNVVIERDRTVTVQATLEPVVPGPAAPAPGPGKE